MIKLKTYTEKEGRDPEVYLGIDGHPIPLKYIKGIFSDKQVLYTDDIFSEVQLMVNDDEKSLFLSTNNTNEYITKEDLSSTDIWFKIGYSGDASSQFMSIEQSRENSPHNVILNKYLSGEVGMIEYSKKIFNDKGEYMRIHNSFDTEKYGHNLLHKLQHHAEFVFKGGLNFWYERNVIVNCNLKTKNEIIELAFDKGFFNGMSEISLDSILKCQKLDLMLIGRCQFKIDEDLLDDYIKMEKES